MHRRHSKSSVLLALGLALCAAVHSTAVSEDAAQQPAIEAIWRVQHLDFSFASSHQYYACDALERKLKGILTALGAHENLTISGGCSGRALVNQMSARISLAAPVPATPENVLAATTFDARDELVARVQGAQLPTAADIVRFPASWRKISLTRNRALRLDSGDCDLLDGIRRQILPHLNVRLTKWSRCSSQSGRIRLALNVEALAPTESYLSQRADREQLSGALKRRPGRADRPPEA